MCDHGRGLDGRTVACDSRAAGTGGKRRAAGRNRRLGRRRGRGLRGARVQAGAVIDRVEREADVRTHGGNTTDRGKLPARPGKPSRPKEHATRRDDWLVREYKQGWADERAGRRASRRPKSSARDFGSCV